MLSYQHGYHAGNPADIHKHYVVLAVASYLMKKPAAIHLFDTHGGKGLYNLQDAQAQKKQEYLEGVAKAVEYKALLQDDIWEQFFATLNDANNGSSELSYYPGSPFFMGKLSREGDRHTVFELHPREHESLAEKADLNLGKVVFGDGLKGFLKALPPQTPRVMALIDPAYERAEEYTDVAETVLKALRKCRHAVILVWYPLIPKNKHAALLASLKANVETPIWQSEWHYQARSSDNEFGMYGSGMLIVNPPWQINEQVALGFKPWLEAGFGQYLGQWLVSEK